MKGGNFLEEPLPLYLLFELILHHSSIAQY